MSLEEVYYSLDSAAAGASTLLEADFNEELFLSGLFSESDKALLASRGLLSYKKAISARDKIRNQIEDNYLMESDPNTPAAHTGTASLIIDISIEGVIITLYNLNQKLDSFEVAGAGVSDSFGRFTFENLNYTDPLNTYVLKWVDPDKRIQDQYSGDAYTLADSFFGSFKVTSLSDFKTITGNPTYTLTGNAFKMGSFNPISGIVIQPFFLIDKNTYKKYDFDVTTDINGGFSIPGLNNGLHILKWSDSTDRYRPGYSDIAELISESEFFEITKSASNNKNIFCIPEKI